MGRPRHVLHSNASWGLRRDEDGSVKGDGLVTYLKAPSVDLAIQIIDGTPLREGLQSNLSVSHVRQAILPPS